MKYPLTFVFKKFALTSKIYISNSFDQPIAFMKQKMLKLKEDIDIFSDESENRLLYNIKADRIFEYSANYKFFDSKGTFIGSVKREGKKSFWKASYLISNQFNKHILTVTEENPWVKVADFVLSEIPLVNMVCGYVFNPAYIITDSNSNKIAVLRKEPSFFQGIFSLNLYSPGKGYSVFKDENEETLLFLSSLMVTMLERGRG